MNFLQTIIDFSEKAAKIARTIRNDPCLFALLVEEKGELDKNARFLRDFKTLADVLIQESLRHHISLKFPHIAGNIFGEENSSFTNTLGENINIHICSSQKETANLLAKVLDGNNEAANVLASVVHEDFIGIEVEEKLKNCVPEITIENVGIWIDPIDSTAEYINGKQGTLHFPSCIFLNGLPCVTVLIGVYDKISGLPIAGIINQPFALKDVSTSRWMSKVFWGLCYNDLYIHSNALEERKNEHKPFIVISGSESKSLQSKLCEHFEIIAATGAGYKCLTVVLGVAEAYFCSKGSTYRWDTCAPHGILRSLKGGIISYKSLRSLGKSQSFSEVDLLEHQLLYHKGNNFGSDSAGKMWCNKDGLIAYRNPEILKSIYDSICLVDGLDDGS